MGLDHPDLLRGELNIDLFAVDQGIFGFHADAVSEWAEAAVDAHANKPAAATLERVPSVAEFPVETLPYQQVVVGSPPIGILQPDIDRQRSGGGFYFHVHLVPPAGKLPAGRFDLALKPPAQGGLRRGENGVVLSCVPAGQFSGRVGEVGADSSPSLEAERDAAPLVWADNLVGGTRST
ncbi:hypothetical protein [Phycisphaera mikurensis]|uniref:Uncharacterized protein n=1 Tax=Phycisphaera mikurensis (strain NBRC 102666 / KCTC 22515 / FYK2301M01) TaxID=1142394 RepID=I0IJD4_PHYMF|nr:hypothetical protein [Phycisphaera mikurensis]MBB6443201.1 hypothetical protein [Phycisphaera mikurensis]BAM05372.1 hypothetical protein PSMK_p00100 [Phycisphaera mikurensis NBRC 102666]